MQPVVSRHSLSYAERCVLGVALKKARMEKKLTQRELAKRLGLSDTSIQHYESGAWNITNGMLNALVDLGIDLTACLNRDTKSQMQDIERKQRRIVFLRTMISRYGRELRKLKKDLGQGHAK